MALGQVQNIVPDSAPHRDPLARAVHEHHVDPGDKQGAGAEAEAGLGPSGRAGRGVARRALTRPGAAPGRQPPPRQHAARL